ncbi:LamG-like jellyroll fold domain-containing protein [Paenibacillus yanchengensis]|uniref:LamG-like jellyroll fold domain-containing protein n=1 Tax=Paenibacillus yanchengensis TaxID=2035833 RepID=A0ABW4YQW2_9BACL
MKKFKTLLLLTLSMLLMLPSMVAAAEVTNESNETKGLLFTPVYESYMQLEKMLDNIPNTVEMTVKLNKDPGVRQVLFGNFGNNATTSFSIEITADNQLRYYETNNGPAIDLKTSGKQITTGEWTKLAITRDVAAKTVKMWQDGTMIAEFTNRNISPQVEMKNLHRIGTDTRSSMYMGGELQELRLWNETLTEEQLHTPIDGREASLKHAWTFSPDALKTTNVIADIKGQNQLTAQNFPVDASNLFPEDYVSAFTGSGTNFADGQLEIAAKERIADAPRTVEAWVKVGKNPQDFAQAGTIVGNYFDNYYHDISRFNFEINALGNPRIYWKSGLGSALEYTANNVNVKIGDWVHVAITLDATNNKATTYINGEQVHESNTNVAIPTDRTAREMKIGSDYRGYKNTNTPTRNFNGELADVRIWSEVRSADQIKANFDQYVNGDEQSLMVNWKLDQQQDGVYADHSTQQNDALIYDDEDTNWLAPQFAEGDYSIVVIPDTQNIVEYKPTEFKQSMQWIKDNKEKHNIQFAIQVGDLVNNPNSDVQWKTAQEGMTILDGTLPYVFLPGNHDMSWSGLNRNTTKYNKYFPYEKYSKQAGFGGAYVEGKMDNTYHTFKVEDVEYLVVAMEFAPNDDVLKWANDVIKAHPDKRVIITTHSYMYHTGEQISTKHMDYPSRYLADGNNGDDVWNELASLHENVVLVVSGHIGYPDLAKREDVGVHGNKVKQVLVDAQFMQHDLGMMMLMTFKKGSNDVDVNWYSVTKDKLHRAKNQYTAEMNIYPDTTTPTTEPVLQVEDKSVVAGKEVEVPLTITGGQQLKGLEGVLQYDEQLLTFEKFELKQFNEKSVINSSTAGKISFAGLTNQTIAPEKSVIGTVTFKAKADIPEDVISTALTLTKVKGVQDLNDGNSVELNVVVKDGKITFITGLVGDIDSNGLINIVDARLLLKMLVSDNPEQLQNKQKIADVNNDQKVDTADVLALLQMIADRLVTTD